MYAAAEAEHVPTRMAQLAARHLLRFFSPDLPLFLAD